MYRDFKHYWEMNKVLLEKAGVERDIAHTIWCTAVDTLGDAFIKKFG